MGGDGDWLRLIVCREQQSGRESCGMPHLYAVASRANLCRRHIPQNDCAVAEGAQCMMCNITTFILLYRYTPRLIEHSSTRSVPASYKKSV